MNKQTLRQYVRMKNEIEQLTAEREALRGKTGGVPDGLPHGTEPGDITGETAVKVAELSEIISARIAELIALRHEIERTVAALEDSRDRQLVYKRYIEGKTWELIAVEMNYTFRWVLILHDRIMKKIEKSSL